MYTIEDFLKVSAAWSGEFSPEGTHIAYLSNETGTSQIYVMKADGRDTKQLTAFEDNVEFIVFSPVQNDIVLFGKSAGGNEQTQFFLLSIETGNITPLTNTPSVRHNFGDWSPDGTQICYSSNQRNGTDFDVYVMDVATHETRCVFEQGGMCGPEGFSPQGTYIVVQQRHSNANTDMFVVHLESGAIEHITPHTGNQWHAGASWLPDESAFFLIQDRDREYNGLAQYTPGTKALDYVLTPEWDIDAFSIDKSGMYLSVVANEEGAQRATLYNPKTLTPYSWSFPAGNIYRVRFSTDSTHAIFGVGDSRHTPDIWTLSLETGKFQQLTHSSQTVPPEVLVEPELIRFTSFDGLSVPAFVYTPQNIAPGTKVPVVINIHGGPEAQFQPVYLSVMQYLVHHGYAVVAPNVRGSSGYGKTYLGLDDVEKRLDSVKDIVALREYLATIPEFDADKVVVYGGSYGGFMVLACLAFYPEYWAAGVDIVGIANFVTFLENTADYRRALREAEYGSLAHHRELLEQISPIHAVANITAPLFVIHGANDPRVPLSEAEQIVAKLRELDRSVELVVYPDEGHGIGKLKNRLDLYPRVVEFLDGVVK